MIRKVKKFYRLSVVEKKYFLIALWYQYLCKFMLIFFSFRRYADRNPAVEQAHPFSREDLIQVKSAIKRTSKLTFWSNKCLIETFAARKLLNRKGIPSKAYLGLTKEGSSGLNAHAWIMVGDLYIVDTEVRYTEVYSF